MRELESKRLLLRRFQKEDAENIFTTWASDPEVTKYLTWPAHETVETTKRILSIWLNDYEKEGCYRYAICQKESGRLMGMIDVVSYMDGNPVIGYVLGRAYWNQGYMTEAFSVVIEELFEAGFSCIKIEADERNLGSNAVILKNGFTFLGKEKRICSAFKPYEVTVNWYERRREDVLSCM